MTMYDPQWRYQQAMQKLSELVVRRSEFLHELEAMCAQASSGSPAEGTVTAFDLERARRILKRIGRHNSQIARAMRTANKYASSAGQRPLEWKQFDPRAAAGSDAESPSAA